MAMSEIATIKIVTPRSRLHSGLNALQNRFRCLALKTTLVKIVWPLNSGLTLLAIDYNSASRIVCTSFGQMLSSSL